jgi:D-alanyl-D-alanine carboxypeptidase
MRNHLRSTPLRLTLALGATAAVVLVAQPAIGSLDAGTKSPCSPSTSGSSSDNSSDVPDYKQLLRNTKAVAALGIPAVQARATTGHATCEAREGVADVQTGSPIPADGAFRIASTSKAFTATVVLQLVGEGRLKLDDRVEQWLPGIVNGRPITVRQLLQHTSGLQDDIPSWTTQGEYLTMRYQKVSTEELVKRGVALPQLFEPGAGWSYSNTGFMIAELLIERLTGNSWDSEFNRRIFQPLGMRNTYWPKNSPDIRLPHAKQYQRFDGQFIDVTSQIPAYATGGVVSTTRDLDVFFRALLSGGLLRPAELAAMKTTVPVSSQFQEFWPGGEYGLGLMSRPLPGGGERYWGHDGGDSGSIVVVSATEDGRRGAAVSMNFGLDASPAETLSQQRAADKVITDALFGRSAEHSP